MKTPYQLLACSATFFICMPLFGQDIDDDQLIDAEKNEQERTYTKEDFTLKSFDSCEDMQTILKDSLKTSIKNSLKHGYHGPVFRGGAVPMVEVMEDSAVETTIPQTGGGNGGGNEDFSETNIQISGVDEPDIIKINSSLIASYQEPQWHRDERKQTPHAVYLAERDVSGSLEVVRRLNLPQGMHSVQLFLTEDELVILGTKWTEKRREQRIIDFGRNQKTVIAVFDIRNPRSPELTRYTLIDGDYRQSRLIDTTLTVISHNRFTVNPWIYWQDNDRDDEEGLIEAAEKILERDDLMPQIVDFFKDDSQILSVGGQNLNFGVNASDTPCESIQYNLPDAETQKEFNTLPEYATITILDIANPTTSVEKHVLFGNIGEIYMSKDSLYTINHHYSPAPFACPFDDFCIMPRFAGTTNSLIHKLDVRNNMKYVGSNLVPGQPLTQYAMHEQDGHFHIITQSWDNGPEVSLFVLDEDLKQTGSLIDVAPGEDFKSSRFMGDKLYLVTFEQVDPLFSIDISDPNNPTIQGELKIPGFSTYLHPYDEDHLLGVGYDTKENEWGGVQTAGIKIDLYDISEFDNPTQKFTKTFGGNGSYSEVLNNPRAFVWRGRDNLLLMPAQLMQHQSGNRYEPVSAWQGLLVIEVDDESGISEKGRISHIDMSKIAQKRREACEKYGSTEPECYTMIGTGERVCEDKIQIEERIPKYCFEEFDDTSYLAQRIWEYNHQFIKRSVYVGDTVFTVSPERIQSNNLSDFSVIESEQWRGE